MFKKMGNTYEKQQPALKKNLMKFYQNASGNYTAAEKNDIENETFSK